VAFGALWGVVVGSVSSAQGYMVPPPPGSICAGNGRASLSVLEASLSPANGATVPVGSPVTFSGPSESPVTFAVASSMALLSSPDIDSGPGSAQPEPFSSGPPLIYTYAFISTKATATPGTVYWDASFSDATLAGCEGLSPATYTTHPRTLTVLPAPASPVPTPAPPPPSPVAPLPVQVSISAPGGFRLAHPSIAYGIHCSASCSGETSYEVLVLRRHAKAVRVPGLDVGPRPVSITAASGGDERFTHRYSGHALQVLKSVMQRGAVELQMSVRVRDISGNVIRAQSTVRLHA
jgi:hypothetical protein